MTSKTKKTKVKSKGITYNGITYTLENLREYMKKDYWDPDDLKFDFWTRLNNHQAIVNELYEINGLNKKKDYKDGSKELKEELYEKARIYHLTHPPMELDLDW